MRGFLTRNVTGLVLIAGVLGITADRVSTRANALTRNAAVQAPGQVAGQLVPLVTDQAAVSLPNTFGAPQSGDVTEAGDLAFLGATNSGVFLRRTSDPAPIRVWQFGAEVPGAPGTRTDVCTAIFINASASVAFRCDVGFPTGFAGVVMTWDGTSIRVIARGNEVAPSSGGATYGRGLTVAGFNDLGSLLLSAPLSTTTASTLGLFFVPAGGSPQRLIGAGDALPGTGGGTVATVLGGAAINNSDQVLFRATIAGGTGGQGVFVWTTSGVRKVAATGDPNPLGGSLAGPSSALLNHAGQVAFVDSASVFVNDPTLGNSAVVAAGAALPPAIGGTLSTISDPALLRINDAGDAIFTHSVVGGATTFALFRQRPGAALEVAAYRGQTAPGGGSQTFNNFSGVSLNSAGLISFIASPAGSTGNLGVFQQAPTGSVTAVYRINDPTASPLGGTYESASGVTRTLSSGAVFYFASVFGGGADHAAFLWQAGSASALMTTADLLPAGANTLLRHLFVEGIGDHVGFTMSRAGGRPALLTHNTATRTTRVVVADGDPSPLPAGGTMRISIGGGSVFSNAAGTVVFTANVVGGTAPGSTVFASPASGGLQKVAAPGDAVAGEVLSGPSFATNTGRAPINSAGQIVFRSGIVGGGNGIFLGTAGGAAVRVARTGELTSAGTTIQNFTPTAGTVGAIGPLLNDAGQIFFCAQTNGAGSPAGLFLAGTPHQLIAQTGDAAPGGGTFSGFRQPSVNNVGRIVFMATTSGGPGSGAYEYIPGFAMSVLALNGGPAPGVGVASLPTVLTQLQPTLVINDSDDVAFRTGLTGSSSDSAYFVRRGGAGFINPVVRQGDSAPGTTGTFLTLGGGINGIPGEVMNLGPDGDIWFLSGYVESGVNGFGSWHVRADNSIEEVLVRGALSPSFGGGFSLSQSQKNSWLSGGRLALRAFVSGGTFTDAIMLFVPSGPTTTPAGTNVSVTPIDSVTGGSPVTLQFSNVTQSGDTSLATSPAGPTLPNYFALGNPPVFYDVSTTAVFAGPVTVCIDFTGVTFSNGAQLRLLHHENGAWLDVTTSVSGNIICGVVATLSPFVIVEKVDTTAPSISVSVDPSTLWPPAGQMVDITATITVSDDFDPTPTVTLVSITANESVAAGDIAGAQPGTDDRSFQLRALRFTQQTGRIYTITYRATDGAGNSALASATVVVPHNRR